MGNQNSLQANEQAIDQASTRLVDLFAEQLATPNSNLRNLIQLPLELSGIREGVCYIGLVYKRNEKSVNQSAACCAAQMFLDSGDAVFKGRVGPWYTGKRGRYHLSREAAEELLSNALACPAATR